MKDEPSRSAANTLIGKSWAELEVIEAKIGANEDGRLLFPDTLHKRGAKGEWKDVKVRFMILRTDEIREARIEARAIAEDEKLDPEKDPDHFENLDTLCQLFRAMREPTPPYEPFAMNARDLEKRFDKTVIEEAWAKYSYWYKQTDPRPSEISKEEMVAVVCAIADSRDIRPLLVLDGRSQDNCIVGMASLLAPYLRPQLSPEPSEPSMPGR